MKVFGRTMTVGGSLSCQTMPTSRVVQRRTWPGQKALCPTRWARTPLEGTVVNILPSGECKTGVRFASPMTRVSKENCVERQKKDRERLRLESYRWYAKRSKWQKTGISRELGVSLSTVDWWLGGHDEILLASMLDIGGFWRSASEAI
jgi:hypothetical protein